MRYISYYFAFQFIKQSLDWYPWNIFKPKFVENRFELKNSKLCVLFQSHLGLTYDPFILEENGKGYFQLLHMPSHSLQILHIFKLSFSLSISLIFSFILVHKVELKVNILKQIYCKLVILLIGRDYPLLLGHYELIDYKFCYFLGILFEV